MIGNALGNKKQDQAFRWNKDICLLGFIIFACLSFLTALAAQPILSLFMTDKTLIPLAKTLLYLNCLCLWIEVLGLVMKDSLIGAKQTKAVLYISACFQWLIFLPGVLLICLVLKGSLIHVWFFEIIIQIAQAIVFSWAWYSLTSPKAHLSHEI